MGIIIQKINGIYNPEGVVSGIEALEIIREFQNKNQEIDALSAAFRLPLLRSIIKELSKLKKIDQAEPDDSRLFDILTQIYNNYELYSVVKKAENEIGTPKILYSRFLGKSDA